MENLAKKGEAGRWWESLPRTQSRGHASAMQQWQIPSARRGNPAWTVEGLTTVRLRHTALQRATPIDPSDSALQGLGCSGRPFVGVRGRQRDMMKTSKKTYVPSHVSHFPRTGTTVGAACNVWTAGVFPEPLLSIFGVASAPPPSAAFPGSVSRARFGRRAVRDCMIVAATEATIADGASESSLPVGVRTSQWEKISVRRTG
jgi:hypothetical protein